jgi:hypothetical protein
MVPLFCHMLARKEDSGLFSFPQFPDHQHLTEE